MNKNGTAAGSDRGRTRAEGSREREERIPPIASPVKLRLALVKNPSLERRLAFDLVNVLTAEVPTVDVIAIGLGIVEEARRREAQECRAWGDRPQGDAA
jgi:hypothetical protein